MNIDQVTILPFSLYTREKTASNVVKKYKHTYATMMYQRTPVELLENLYMGDLAKNALLEYLRPRCTHTITDFDEVRSDRFLLPDPGWDIKVGEAQVKLEVKSSIPPNQETPEEIIRLRDIKITASHNNGKTWIKPEDIESEIHVQVYFYTKSNRSVYKDFELLYQDLERDENALHHILVSSRFNEPMFFGWNQRENIIRFTRTLKPHTWGFPRTKRIYYRCPIKDAFSLPQLVTHINTL